eukprot:TRINITY_DN16727_c0_g3_i1.p1 TRINITY_DN16727_c0_g3~~TRINITY_DN16727_c0_g3_i1.p1  ORF type:complete len:202 (-),score=61.01 TRINITY_DN16727_c0_g3_i1:138-743(-)
MEKKGRKDSKLKSYKIVLLGDIAVGKSSILERFVFDTFTSEKTTTLAACFTEKIIILGATPVKFALWDTAGQEKYASLANFYYKSAEAAFIIFDVSNLNSFQRAKLWLNELDSNCAKRILIILVGNKIDLHERQVGYETAVALAKENKLLYFEASAREGVGIDELFTAAASMLLKSDNAKAERASSLSRESFSVRKPCSCQ